MSDQPLPAVTQLLDDVRRGDVQARDRLIEVIYGDLRDRAGKLMRRERPDHTLQATALVNEAMLRLLPDEGLRGFENRMHFMGAAVRAMRRVLVDHARAKQVQKRGGQAAKVPLDDLAENTPLLEVDMLGLDDALKTLEKAEPRQSEVIMLRMFGGLTNEQIATQLNVSIGTVERDLRIARAWLKSRLEA